MPAERGLRRFKMRASKFGQWQIIFDFFDEARDPTVRYRLCALAAVACGNPVNKVSQWFGVTRQTLHNWMRRWRNSGFCPESLVDEPRPGRPPQWEQKLTKRVEGLLEHSPRHFGYPTSNWTVGLLRDYLASQEGLCFSPDTVRRHLHHLGLVWKRPRYVLESDPEREKKSQFAETAAFTA
jgi:transposase